MTKRAVTYARVSYDDRDTGGRNLEMGQLELCRDHCEKRGHVIIREFREDDKGACGADFDLPALSELLDMARERQFDVLVARELDRLSRDKIKAQIIRRDLLRLGIEIEYALYEFPPGPEGDLARSNMEAVAEYVRQQAIIKTKRGRRDSVRSGNVNVAGRAPYGYRVIEKGTNEPLRRLAIHEPEARIVRMIFDWYTRGDGESKTPLTMNAITRRLSELRIPTPSENDPKKQNGTKRKGAGEWNRNIVKRMLRCETYAGRWYYGKRRRVKEDELDPATSERLRGRKQGGRHHKAGQKYAIENPRAHWLERPVPAIVDDATWQAAQEQVTANRRNAWRPTGEEYLLRGRLTCGKCGASVQCESSARPGQTKYRYYACCANRHRLNYSHQCRQPSFRADWVDAEVWKWIKGLLSEPDKLQKSITELEQEGERQAAPKRRRLAALAELIGENTAELARVKAMCQRGIYTLDEAAGKTAQIEETLGRLNKERVKLEKSIAQQVQSSENVRAVLAFAKEQGPNVERATKRFDVRRGLMEDLEVTASLSIAADGIPEVNASCVVGKKTLRQDMPTTCGECAPAPSTARALPL